MAPDPDPFVSSALAVPAAAVAAAFANFSATAPMTVVVGEAASLDRVEALVETTAAPVAELVILCLS
jgi:hypothetical protein